MEKFKDTFSVKRIISDLMKANGIGIFRTFRVGDLLWGYEDPLLKVIKPMVEMDDHFDFSIRLVAVVFAVNHHYY